MRFIYLLFAIILTGFLVFLLKDKLFGATGWKDYKTEDVISGVSISYPVGWRIRYKKEDATSTNFPAKFTILFDIAPASWPIQADPSKKMGWGGLSFKAFNVHSNISDFIAFEYPVEKNYLIYDIEKNIGAKPTYFLKTKPSAPFYDSWEPKYVVLGTLYSYEMAFFDSGEYGFSDNIQEKILPVTFIY